ncbi:MAG: hypothetical protein HY875_07805 [Chloroflexi bacterium]|nr:hypothetical protein [Chloroflexota bacterium]
MRTFGDSAAIACYLDVFEPAETVRHRDLLAELRGAITGAEELVDGFALLLEARPGLYGRVAEWVTLERRCCSFLNFALEWPTGDGAAIRLRLTGPEGAKDVLRPLLPD